MATTEEDLAALVTERAALTKQAERLDAERAVVTDRLAVLDEAIIGTKRSLVDEWTGDVALMARAVPIVDLVER